MVYLVDSQWSTFLTCSQDAHHIISISAVWRVVTENCCLISFLYLISSIKSVCSNSESEHLREIAWSQHTSLASPFCTRKKAMFMNKEIQISTQWFSYTYPQGKCRGWIGGAELWIKEVSLSVEAFQQPHHSHSLIITQLIQNPTCLTFRAIVLRCLTDGEKWTTGKLLVPDYSNSSRARAALLGPGSRRINSLHWTEVAWQGEFYASMDSLNTQIYYGGQLLVSFPHPILQVYTSETSIDYILHRCSISYNIPLHTLPAHTPAIGKVDGVYLETPILPLKQPYKLSLGRKEAKIPGLQALGT